MSRSSYAAVPLSARLSAIAAMTAVVVASNVLVQYPVEARIGGVDLADLLTWGAFSYPLAFLVTDLTNRRFGARVARRIVFAGFAVAVMLSLEFSTPRIALASGFAFLVGQLLDVTLFDRLRRAVSWWKAPFVGSVAGSITDTTVFFSLAFAPVFAFIAASDAFAIDWAPLLGVATVATPRWISWALADLSVKLLFAIVLLVPYRLVMNVLWPLPVARTA
ncbi:MAG: VUT family protein [Ancalomicrobiaceae bacterium]|nr:VUT family protein [Ancalomicrobiaceae bacterium]